VLNWRRSLPAAGANAGRVVAELAGVTRRAAARVRADGGTVVGLTVAVPGLVDTAGVVRSAPALGWTNVELGAALTWALGKPDYRIEVDSDATLGALAEHRYGAHAGSRHLVYLAGSPGGGMGLISGGAPFRGVHGYGGTLGHLRVDPGGPVCGCGRTGCLDAVAGLDALLRRTGTEPQDIVARDVEVASLVRRADGGEESVLSALAEAGRWLGCAVAVLVDLLHPAVVLLGGYYAGLAPWLLPPLEREVRALALAPDAGGLQVAASHFGYEAAALGGAAVALDTLDSTGIGRSLSGHRAVAAP
jgi:predicted NBD/HSP70 family sugar kinase